MKYRTGVGMVLINKEKKVFIAKRRYPPSKLWQLPQGGVQKSENLLEAVKRELREETSVSSINIIAEHPTWHYYDFPKSARRKFSNDYIGQRQKWFLVAFHGSDEEVNVQTHTPEFKSWKWAPPSEAIEKCIDFKKNIYIEVFEYFKDYFK